MTTPSEMTDAELWLAIVEKLGYKDDDDGYGGWFKKPDDDGSSICRTALPNRPGDNSAALGLLDEYDEVDIWKDSTGWNCAFGGAFCHGKPFPRALSECWLTAKENDA